MSIQNDDYQCENKFNCYKFSQSKGNCILTKEIIINVNASILIHYTFKEREEKSF